MAKTRQDKVDEEMALRAKRPKPAIGNNGPGGESIDSVSDGFKSGLQNRAMPVSFKGIKIHDKDKNTWEGHK